MRTYVQDLQELNITSADFDKALSALYDKTETEMLAISTAIRNDLDVHPVIIRGFERVLHMRHTERSQAYEYHFKQRDDVSNVIMLGFFKWESGSLNDNIRYVLTKKNYKYQNTLGGNIEVDLICADMWQKVYTEQIGKDLYFVYIAP